MEPLTEPIKECCAISVLLDRIRHRPAARTDALHELIAELEERLPLGRSSRGEVIAILTGVAGKGIMETVNLTHNHMSDEVTEVKEEVVAPEETVESPVEAAPEVSEEVAA